jgi:branched-chain amino acid transport system substrate-binding protein
MRRWLLALWLATAGPVCAQAPAIVVGAVLPASGQLADLGEEMRKALVLWQEHCSAEGGLLGRAVALRLLDDGSEASASLRLYEQLIRSEQADLLLGPLGSAATMAAAATVERAGQLLLNVTGVTESVQREGRRQVFHVPAPLSAYGAGPLAIAESAGHTKLQVLARNDPRSREAAERLAEAAARRGLQAVVQFTAPGATEYAAQIAAARARNAEAWIAFGIPEDAAEMVKTFKRIGYAPWLFLAQGAAQPEFIRRVGQDAELALGLTAYEPNAKWPANQAFLAAWRERWQGEPGVLAAHAYAAGLVLQAAVRAAGTLETERLRAALRGLEVDTPLGRHRVDADGVQVGVKPAVVQIQRGRREVVWPPELATAQWQLPYPRWDERRVHAPQ